MNITRNQHLQYMINNMHNGTCKVITGIRRCGKSYLLFEIFKNYLKSIGVDDKHIITFQLDAIENENLRIATELYKCIEKRIKNIKDKKMIYVLLDEIQLVENFEDVINSLLYKKNVDVYVTGSNSKFLSTDIITEFRGRQTEIRLFPLSFKEYMSVYNGNVNEGFKDYYTYGALPQILTYKDIKSKRDYLKSLCDKLYITDILERNHIKNENELDILLSLVSSSVGSLTNVSKIARTFKSEMKSSITDKTIKKYLSYLQDAFIIDRADRYDVKGKKYISSLSKYYFTDMGIRNAKLNFRQIEPTHLMENIIYNDLLIKGYTVDIGVIEKMEKGNINKYEIDFIADKPPRKIFIQSAYNLEGIDKESKEKRGLYSINESFEKIVLVNDDIEDIDNKGVKTMDVKKFLLSDEY